jgi:uncharacterized circularly permuted ATP-grasp superfamily protein/uncharacterized alpha-E superfamily protein
VLRHQKHDRESAEGMMAEKREPEEKLFASYEPTADAFDEMAEQRGSPREHWRKFLESFERLGTDELAQRWDNAQRLIREHGVTYNVYGDPQGNQRPWQLDMVPVLIQADEWTKLEEGLKQRTQLLQLILQDLYGPQQLLQAGLLPPALVFANPRFLRACHGIEPGQGTFIHLHGVDLARSPNGQWWVLADRTQTPSGAGYALENRIVVSRLFPEGFRDSQVQRLASFFRFFRDNMRNLSPRSSANPTVVLLTPGPHNETYFEHAYMARYLGITLVEGGDLTVRNREVYIKNLEGLQRVDVILRRVDDTFCDPLELRDDSFLGVAGLVEAYRAGNVAIANALGAGLVESPAFLAFLPSLCKHLLGEELKLPSVATWWCGQEREQNFVEDNVHKLVVKPAFRPTSTVPLFGQNLTKQERNKIIAMIAARPFEFVGQEQVALSTTPVWDKDRLVPRPLVLRAYIAAGQEGPMIMPGGLARVSASVDELIVSMQSGGGSKDAWILSHKPVTTVSLLTASGQPVAFERSSSDLPSRVADNLFWLGRYAERMEDLLRFLRCLLSRMAEEAALEASQVLPALAELAQILGLVSEGGSDRSRTAELEKEVLQLIFGQTRGGIRELANRIRYIASVVRDRFSADTWRILNQIQSDLRSRPGRLPLSNGLALLNKLITDLAAFSGMEMENMTRGHGWRFLDFGRRVERGFRLSRLLHASIKNSEGHAMLLEPLLEIADSSLTYRRRYYSQAQLPGVLDLLVFERQNPRSIAFQVAALSEHAYKLPGASESGAGTEEQRLVQELAEELETVESRSLGLLCEEGDCQGLERFLNDLARQFGRVSESLTHHYFTHTLAQVS